MASNRRFILLIFGVKLADVRAAIATAAQHPSATEKNSAKRVGPGQGKPGDPRATSSQASSLIDFADYSEVPHVYTNQSEFPHSTNLLCWHCCLAFTRIPRFIAIESVRIARDQIISDAAAAAIQPAQLDTYKWIIDGNFCSWACAAAYIEQHYDESKKWALLQNLAVVRAQVDNVKIQPVKSAPSRIKMRLYCGKIGMSQQEYSELVESLSVP